MKIKIAEFNGNPVYLVEDSRGESENYEAVSMRCERPDGTAVWVEGVRKDRAFMDGTYRREIDAILLAPSYFTVLIPWSANRTDWHPLAVDRTGPWSVITRGAFDTESEAHAWATEHLAGQPYTVKFIDAPRE